MCVYIYICVYICQIIFYGIFPHPADGLTTLRPPFLFPQPSIDIKRRLPQWIKKQPRDEKVFGGLKRHPGHKRHLGSREKKEIPGMKKTSRVKRILWNEEDTKGLEKTPRAKKTPQG